MLTESPPPGSVNVPAATYETQVWTPSTDALYSRAESRRQRGEYKSIVPAPLADWQPALPPAAVADVEDGVRALVEFDQHALRTIGGGSPALAPMSAILLRTESASSSQIENLSLPFGQPVAAVEQPV